MKTFVVSAQSVTASFRIPENHTFQPTLPLPPITTIIGMAGAALGYSNEESFRFWSKSGIKVGVYSTYEGFIKDLWKYRKRKSGDKEPEISAVLIRELLADFKLRVLFAADTDELIVLHNAFNNPKYALSAGSSDDILKIHAISEIFNANPEIKVEFCNTVLPGDQCIDYIPNLDLENTPVTYSIRAPQVYLLPTDFEFLGEKRKVKEKKLFTFIGSSIRIKQGMESICHEGVNYPLL